MLIVYDPYEEWTGSFDAEQVQLKHLAGELLQDIGIHDATELQQILERAFDVCCQVNLPIEQHFKKVFLFSDGQLITDWLLSDMASYLLLVNGDPRNYNVARAQLGWLPKTG